MEGPLAQEARSLVASARALLTELAEEGVEVFPPAGEPSPAQPPVAADSAAAPSSSQPALLDAHPWGPNPTLEQVREVLGECTRCRLSEQRTIHSLTDEIEELREQIHILVMEAPDDSFWSRLGG